MEAPLNLTIEIDQEEDGRFIADVVDIPGVLAYGKTREEAVNAVTVLALRVIADRVEHGEPIIPKGASPGVQPIVGFAGSSVSAGSTASGIVFTPRAVA